MLAAQSTSFDLALLQILRGLLSMKYKNVSILKLAMVSTLVIMIPITTNLSHVNTPKIFYYSVARQAFIIERADGTESRLLAHYFLPAGHTQIVGAGWSPSGQWFSWTSQRANGLGANNVYITSRDGQTNITLFPEDVILQESLWSPTDDYLLVRVDPSFNDVSVYDPGTNEFLEKIVGRELSMNGGEVIFSAEWSPDGRLLALYDHGSDTVRIVAIGEDRATQVFPARGTPLGGCEFGRLPHWIDSKHLAYLDPIHNQLIIRDIQTGTLTSIEMPEKDVDHADWTSDGNYALIYTVGASYIDKLWLLSRDTESVQLLSEDALYGTNCRAPFNHTFWNSINQAFFVSDVMELYLVEAEKQEAIKIMPSVQGAINAEEDIQWTPEGNLEFLWYVPELHGIQVYRYLTDAQAFILVDPELPTLTSHASVVSISNQGYRAYGDFIINPATGERFATEIQTTRNYGPLGIVDVRWHPTKDWLFLISSEIEDLDLINVRNLDGTVQLELGLCPLYSKTCFGWLPDEVVIKR